MADSKVPEGEPAADGVLQQVEPIVLKNGMAVLTPDPIAEGAFGQVYVGKILNPIGLLAERIVWGEESPRWLGLDDIPYIDPDKDGKAGLPTPVMDPIHRARIYQAADRMWKEYLERRKQDRDKATEEYRDLLNLIDPLLHEDRIIAVKVLRPPVENDPELDRKIVDDSVRRFIKENDILRTLRHTGIVRRFGLAKDDKMGWCILMEYIEGETLDVHLRRFTEGRLPLPRAAQIAREIADALQYIHQAGVVHRDMKPQNIMIRKDDGRAVIMDFGIGKWTNESNTQALTMSGMRVGTPRYMSPEQAKADVPVGTAADVYSLSTILYEMVTGHMAYENLEYQTIFNWLADNSKRHPMAVRDFIPSLSGEYEALIEVGREKDPEKRWTVEEFRSRLDGMIGRLAFEGAPPAAPQNKTEILTALRQTRMRKKELAWEEHLLGMRLLLSDLHTRIQDAWALLEKKSYLEAQKTVEGLRKEVASLPAGRESLKAEFENLERAFTRATARHETESLLDLAEQHAVSARYPEAGATLDSAARRLDQLPKEAYADVHQRFKKLADLYDAQHRSFVDLFNALRKSFVEKIQERYKDLHERYGAGKTIEGAKIADLLQQVDTAQRNLITIERDKVGAAPYDATKKDLWELKVALEDLHRRTVGSTKSAGQ
ncbi:MAG TPA: protein kinase [Planctomycetota bacterium]|nr:protein kinase [Planctomycetota bacterium]